MEQNLIAVVDGQGGGIGKALVERLKKELPGAHVRALGTNSAATERMLRAGADDGATGENAVIVNVKKARVIMGVLAILMPNGLLGEMSPAMAEAVGSAEGLKVLVPMQRCNIRVAVSSEDTVARSIEEAVRIAGGSLIGAWSRKQWDPGKPGPSFMDREAENTLLPGRTGAAAGKGDRKPMAVRDRESIDVYGAYENNLKHISLKIPKKEITIFTGVSGSGKSSLCLDTIAASSRRELNETFPSFVQRFLPKYGRPHVERIENLPVTIVIDQKKPAPNARSTVGTYTDTYSLLRLLFSRVGEPFVGYSDTFSFNHPLGRCPRCDGLGEVTEIDLHKLVDFDKSLNEEGCINYIAFKPGGWRWIVYANSGLFDLNKKIKDYTPEELELFLYSPQIRLKNPPENWPKTAKYEGLMTRMYRSIIKSDEGKRHQKLLEPMTTTMICPDCHGARLNPAVLSCRINGRNIAEVTGMAIPDAIAFLKGVEGPIAADLKRELVRRLSALEQIGLGYLTLSRGMGTLSGGEAQRCKIAKYINSSLADMVYVLDEPSVGLHSHDIHLLKDSVRRLRDHGNTVLLVEHHKEMIRIADRIVDMGPGSGSEGGGSLR